jgi:hypothetical protein
MEVISLCLWGVQTRLDKTHSRHTTDTSIKQLSHCAPISDIAPILELEIIHSQLAQKPMLRPEVYARALCASQDVRIAEVWVGARCG